MKLFYSHSIEELFLTTRVHNALWWDDKRTVEQLKKISDAEFLRIPNFGKAALQEVKEQLAKWNAEDRGKWVPTVLPQPDPVLVEIRDLLRKAVDRE